MRVKEKREGRKEERSRRGERGRENMNVSVKRRKGDQGGEGRGYREIESEWAGDGRIKR